MKDIVINNSQAGFWVRFVATWVDLFIAGRLFLYLSRFWNVPYFVEENVR